MDIRPSFIRHKGRRLEAGNPVQSPAFLHVLSKNAVIVGDIISSSPGFVVGQLPETFPPMKQKVNSLHTNTDIASPFTKRQP